MIKLIYTLFVLILWSGAAFSQISNPADRKTAVAEPWKQATPGNRNHSELSISVAQMIISLPGKKIKIGSNGFPEQVQLFFDDSLHSIIPTGRSLLAENIHFHFVRKADGKNIKLTDRKLAFTSIKDKKVSWKAVSSNDSLKVEVSGTVFNNGEMIFEVKNSATQAIDLKEVTMHIPFEKSIATMIFGLGQTGGLRPEKVEWNLDQSLTGPVSCWIGTVNAGLQYALFLAPNKKNGWWNEGKGGVTIGIKGSSMLANNHTGSHQMKKAEVKFYRFKILPTPVQLPKN